MKDGSDAIADWPILNAPGQHGRRRALGERASRRRRRHRLLASTLAWWWWPTAPRTRGERLARVLTSDPGTGVVRHADAGYERAIEVADERGVRIPMREP